MTSKSCRELLAEHHEMTARIVEQLYHGALAESPGECHAAWLHALSVTERDEVIALCAMLVDMAGMMEIHARLVRGGVA